MKIKTIIQVSLLCLISSNNQTVTNPTANNEWDPLERFHAVATRLYTILEEENKINKELSKKMRKSENHVLIQKKIIPQDAHIYVKTDIHGDPESIPPFIKHLQRHGLMNQTYILDKNVFIIFLGDYIDRGPNSVEVLRQIIQLKKQNPDNVILLRGNHETYPMVLSKEGEKHDSNKLSKQLLHIPSNYHTNAKKHREKIDKILQTLNAAFALMPQVAFVGCRDPQTAETHYIAYLHAGIPHQPQQDEYPKNKQGQKAYQKDQERYTQHIKELKTLLQSAEDDTHAILHLDHNGHKGYMISPYLWNDFLPTDTISQTKKSVQSSRGKNVWSLADFESHDWLEEISSPGHTVHSIIRGHQQSPRNLFEVKGHEGLAMRNGNDVLTLDYSPRVQGFKAKKDVYLFVTPDHQKKNFFHKKLKTFSSKAIIKN